MLATEGKWQTREHAADWRRAIAAALAVSLVLVIMLAMLLVTRRLSGALAAPLPFVPLFSTAALLAAWAYAIRSWLDDWRPRAVAAAAIVMFAIGCSASSGRLVDWLAWSVALAAPFLAPIWSRRESKTPDPAEVTLQQLTRTRSADGVETVRGTLVAEFAPAERLSILYVAFCPPLEPLPKVECEVVAGPLCEVKVAQIFHQGTRLEARLLRASTTAVHVTISIVASERPPTAV